MSKTVGNNSKGNIRKKKKIRKKIKSRLLIVSGIILIMIIALIFSKIFYDEDKVNPESEYVTNIEGIQSINGIFGETRLSLDNVELSGDESKSKLNKKIAEKMLKRLGMEEESVDDIIKNIVDGNGAINREQWQQVLEQVININGLGDICKTVEVPVFATNKTSKDLKKKEILTDIGVFTSDYYDLLNMTDKTIHIIHRDNNIVYIDRIEYMANYSNVYLTEKDDEYIISSLLGYERRIKVSGFEEDVNGILADIDTLEGRVVRLGLKRDIIQGKVLAIDDENIEIEGFKKLGVSSKVRFYLNNKEDNNLSINNVNMGDNTLRFIVAEHEICGILFSKIDEENKDGEEEYEPQNIRVLIKNNGFKDYYHDSISLKCASGFKLEYLSNIDENDKTAGEKVLNQYGAGEELTIDCNNEILKTSRIWITPNDSNSKIELLSINRADGVPAYRGIMEIALIDGRLVLINELSVEQYLYTVVPSEMPSSYGIEALKVQAICARSYAMSHMNNGRLSGFGAHVDDSTDFQVYNNTKETENSIAAVDETKGLVMKYDGTIVNAYFYATSCGSTTDGNIWGSEVPYLKEKLLREDGKELDLKDNKVFLDFIKQDYETFDSGYGWYRWQVSMSDEKIKESIEDNVHSMYADAPQKVLTLQENGEYVSQDVYEVGEIKEIRIEKRGAGGIIEEMVIVGSEKTIKILNQSYVRRIFNPYGNEIIKLDGSIRKDFNSLPSAFFAVERTENDKGYIFYGGGYGHGAGMSQTAVKSMIDAGWDYGKILTFFYEGISIED